MNRTALASGISAVLLVVTCLVSLTAAAAQSTIRDTVTLMIDPQSTTVVLGENFDLAITVTNSGPVTTPALIVHIDITDPGEATSVDPEDWTPTLSKPIGVLDPGESTTVDWNLQPISPGSFATYAVALSPGVDTIASSNVLEVTVVDQRSLNPGGILPVAIGGPVLVGGFLLVQIRATRRSGEVPSAVT